MSTVSFTEDDLHNLILGNLEIIEPNLILKENKPSIDGSQIDIWCKDENNVDVFVELEWHPASASSKGQILNYKLLVLEPNKKALGFSLYRLIFFVPDISETDKTELQRSSIEVKTYDKDELTKRLHLNKKAQDVLGQVLQKLSSTVPITILKARKDMDLIHACYYHDRLPDPKTGKLRKVGLGKTTIGFMLEMTKIMIQSNLKYTNPDLLLKLIYWNLKSPIHYKYRGKGFKNYFDKYSLTMDFRGLAPVQEKIRGMLELLENHLQTYIVEGDLLEKLSKELVRKIGRNRIEVNQAFAFIRDKFNFKSQYQAKGVPYSNNMVVRVLELMVLRGVCFVNPGPGRFSLLSYDRKHEACKIVVPISFDFVFNDKLYRNPTEIQDC